MISKNATIMRPWQRNSRTSRGRRGWGGGPGGWRGGANLAARKGTSPRRGLAPRSPCRPRDSRAADVPALSDRAAFFAVAELWPAPPAATNQGIQKNDTIRAVAEGDKPAVSVSGKQMAEVVNMLRGKVGTPVRLTVIPADAK